MNKRKAFTLIELLVVIAIIALLMAILMPALSLVRFQAKVAACTANFHQWALIMNVYASDYDAKLPRFDLPATGRNVWDVSNDFIRSMMLDYKMPGETFFCPVARPQWTKNLSTVNDYVDFFRLTTWYPGINPKNITDNKYYSTFSRIPYNYWVPRKNGNEWMPTDPADRDSYPDSLYARNASRLPVLTDILRTRKSKEDIDYAEGGHKRHGSVRSTNLLFGDGHIETRKPEDMKIRHSGNWHNWY